MAVQHQGEWVRLNESGWYMVRWCLVGVFVCLLALNARAGERVYSVGVENLSYYPFYQNEQGEYSGFARDLLDAFARYQKIQFVYKVMAVSDLFPALINGHIDFKFPDNEYWQAEMKAQSKVVYSQGVLEYVDGALVLWPKERMSLEHITRLGTITAFTPFAYQPYIESGKIKVQEYPSLDGLMRAILNQKVDAGYFNVLMAQHFIVNISLPTMLDVKSVMDIKIDRPIIEFHPNLPHTKDFYKLSSIKHPHLINGFNQFLRDEKNLVDAIKEKYLTLP